MATANWTASINAYEGSTLLLMDNHVSPGSFSIVSPLESYINIFINCKLVSSYRLPSVEMSDSSRSAPRLDRAGSNLIAVYSLVLSSPVLPNLYRRLSHETCLGNYYSSCIGMFSKKAISSQRIILSVRSRASTYSSIIFSMSVMTRTSLLRISCQTPMQVCWRMQGSWDDVDFGERREVLILEDRVMHSQSGHSLVFSCPYARRPDSEPWNNMLHVLIPGTYFMNQDYSLIQRR